jgi:hypothetical protein
MSPTPLSLAELLSLHGRHHHYPRTDTISWVDTHTLSLQPRHGPYLHEPVWLCACCAPAGRRKFCSAYAASDPSFERTGYNDAEPTLIYFFCEALANVDMEMATGR